MRPEEKRVREARRLRLQGYSRREVAERLDVGFVYVGLLLQGNAAQVAAGRAVTEAISRGDLVRPERCSDCDGEGTIQAHHSDYSKPLDVLWLCPRCHKKLHHDLRPGRCSATRPHPDKDTEQRCRLREGHWGGHAAWSTGTPWNEWPQDTP